MLENPDLDTYVDAEVVDDTGTPVGTVVDVDRQAETLYLEPSPELDVHTWESVGWHTADDYDANWEDLDYDAWLDGEADVPVEYREWPFTLPVGRLEDADESDRLRVD